MQNAKANTAAVVPFQFNNSQIRAVIIEDAHWIVAKDVCDVLGLENARDAVATLDDDERNTVAITDGKRGNPNHTVVNESGLYALIFKSRKPEAKAFRKWVTAVVLPALRKTGQFRITNPNTTGRPGPEWFTAKEIAPQWNVNLRTAQRHLAIMAAEGRCEMDDASFRRYRKRPILYRFPDQNRVPQKPTHTTTEPLPPSAAFHAAPPLGYIDLTGKRFAGTIENGCLVLRECRDDIADHSGLPRWLADPGITISGPDKHLEDDKELLITIAQVASMRAAIGAHDTWTTLYGKNGLFRRES